MWAALNWGWLFYVEDYSLPTYIRIVISQYKDPYEPINKNNNFETPKKPFMSATASLNLFSTCCGLVLTLIARGWIWVPPIWALSLTTSWQCWGNKSFADALPDGFCLMHNLTIYILHVHKFTYLYIHMVEYLTSTCFTDVSIHPRHLLRAQNLRPATAGTVQSSTGGTILSCGICSRSWHVFREA